MNTLESTELESLKSLNIKVKTLKEDIADIEVSLSSPTIIDAIKQAPNSKH